MPILLTITQGLQTGRELTFESAEVNIGRTSENDLVLHDHGVSRQHARIVLRDDKYYVADMGSSNGTVLNGSLLSGEQQLRDGDKIGVGPVEFTFVWVPPEGDEDATRPIRRGDPLPPVDPDATRPIRLNDPVPAASGSMAAVTGGGASVVKPQNLTVMLTDIQGFTERTSRQTHEENARMLETHDKLLMPLVKEHDGRLVQKRGDALLVVFRSPTSAVLCGMAMQDRLWRHNQTVPELDRLNVRVCLHAGEVLATTDTVLGEPMEVVEAVEHVASAGEVTFTEAVNLARNRAEVTAEPCGTIALPGRDEQLQLYRCERAAEGPPFGDRFASQGGRAGALAPLLAKLQTVKLPTGWGELLRHRRREAALVAGAVVLLAAGAAWLGQRNDAGARAFALLEDGKLDEALALMDGATDEEKALPSLRRARVAAHHSKGHHISERTALNHLKEEELEDLEPLILDGLAEDYGKEQLTVLERSLARIPKDRVRAHYEDLAEEAYSLRQWGALRYLEFAKAADGVDLVRAYSEALNASDCDIRTQAANRLAGLGDADAIPALERVTGLPREKGVFGSKDCGHEAAAAAIKSLKKKHD